MAKRRISPPWLILLAALAIFGIATYENRRGVSLVLSWIWSSARSYTLDGKVVDAKTGQGVPGVDIRIFSVGWDVWGGSPFGSQRMTRARTSDLGRFHVKTRLLGEPILHLSKAGYLDASARPSALEGILVSMEPLPPDVRAVRRAVLEMDCVTHWEVYHVDFLALAKGGAPPDSLALSAEDSDLTIRLLGPDRGGMDLEANPGGGLVLVPGDASPDTEDPFGHACTAPDTGYVHSVHVARGAPPMICFIRTRDGRHYGKIQFNAGEFDPRSYAPRVRLTPAKSIWLNRAGGHGVCSSY